LCCAPATSISEACSRTGRRLEPTFPVFTGRSTKALEKVRQHHVPDAVVDGDPQFRSRDGVNPQA
jgi:hypothetical protein